MFFVFFIFGLARPNPAIPPKNLEILKSLKSLKSQKITRIAQNIARLLIKSIVCAIMKIDLFGGSFGVGKCTLKIADCYICKIYARKKGGISMKKKRNPITMERHRTKELIVDAYLYLLNRKCCVWLHIASGMSHGDVKDELFEDFMKAYTRISFSTVEIPELPCVRSERTTCIIPKDAAVVDGELCGAIAFKQPTRISSSESQVWRFAGGIWLINRETCFCEYDAGKREGGMMIFFDGRDIFRLLVKYPQLRRKIKIAKSDQYDLLVKNW